MTPEQCRAARAWVNWSQTRLARAANVNAFVVRDFEIGRREPALEIQNELRAALEKVGITFVKGANSLEIIVENDTTAINRTSAMD